MAKRKSLSAKAIAQKKHFARRIWYRYGITCTNELIKRIVADIQNGRATFVEKQSHTRSIFVVQINGTDVPLVYDRSRKTLVTALPTSYVKGDCHAS